MDDYLFRAPTPDDITYLAANMRQVDRDEIFAASGSLNVAAVLHESINTSPLCVSVEKQGRLLCIGGASRRSLLSSAGTPWMLGTDDLLLEGRLFVAHGKRSIQSLLCVFDRLENYVDARNTKSIRWLKRIGFTVENAAPYGRLGLPFHRFTVQR